MGSLSLIIGVVTVFLSHDILKWFSLPSLVKQDVIVLVISVRSYYVVRFYNPGLQLLLIIREFLLVELLVD